MQLLSVCTGGRPSFLGSVRNVIRQNPCSTSKINLEKLSLCGHEDDTSVEKLLFKCSPFVSQPCVNELSAAGEPPGRENRSDSQYIT